MAEKFITTWFYAGVHSEQQAAGLFGNKLKTVQDPKFVNFDDFSKNLADVYNNLDRQGYDVVNIVPISMGTSEPRFDSNQSPKKYVGDVGFTATRGAVVVGKRRDE